MTEEPLIQLKIPTLGKSTLPISLSKGSKLFVVGPNGSGKSALLSSWAKTEGDNIKILRAHRRNWMKSSAVNISPSQRDETEKNYAIYQKASISRYTDPYESTMISNALFDLAESENALGRKARQAIIEHNDNREEKLTNLEKEFKEQNSPLGKLNNILAHSLFNTEISLSTTQQILATKNGETFEASQLSDGERNALILSCHVLSSPTGTIFFIDEPEQHLHRAIASPMLSALISERSDCAFVIFTHELSLVETVGEAQVLVLHGCCWTDFEPTAWDANLLRSDDEIPNDTRRAILGGRKKVLFVEGTANSLDRRLYEVIYPDFTVHPVGGCSEVIRTVLGLKKNPNLHWISAYGIIDNDGRNKSDIDTLNNDSIFVLQTFSIESLIYGEEARTVIAKNKAKELNKDANDLLSQTTDCALQVLSGHADRLAARRCCHKIERAAINKIPDWKDILTNSTETIEISFPSPFDEEKEKFQNFLNERNLEELIANYPVRESETFNKIAETLHYQSPNDYEAAVIECVKNIKEFRNALKNILPRIGEKTN